MAVHIDFETMSAADLRKIGARAYAYHPSTQIMMLSWQLTDNQSPALWTPGYGPIEGDSPAMLSDLFDAVRDGRVVTAHNILFEWWVWEAHMVRHWGAPSLQVETVDCTMARAYADHRPASLDQLAKSLRLSELKDGAGGKLTLQVAKLQVQPTQQTHLVSAEYCRQDVRTERAAARELPDLSPFERRTFQTDLRINTRGFPIDREAVQWARQIVQVEQKRLADEMAGLAALDQLGTTAVPPGTPGSKPLHPNHRNKILNWLQASGFDGLQGLRSVDVRRVLKEMPMPDDVRRVIEIRAEFCKSSNAKLDAMLNRAEPAEGEFRAYGCIQYSGAGATRRWAGRAIQPHNMPRGKLDMSPAQVDWVLTHKPDRDTLYAIFGDPMQVISDCLRGMIATRPDRAFAINDFSGIEARVLPWLSGEHWKLADIRAGVDLYKKLAVEIFGLASVEDVTKPQRQNGKVGELSLGFGGGENALLTMAEGLDVEFTLELAKATKLTWRRMNNASVRLWRDFEGATRLAVQYPGIVFTFREGDVRQLGQIPDTDGRMLYPDMPDARHFPQQYGLRADIRVVALHDHGRSTKTLYVLLPSGGLLRYHDAIIGPSAPREMEDGTVWYPPATVYYRSPTWGFHRRPTYGGLFTENAVQATARDLQADALNRTEDHMDGRAGVQGTCLHVHDEIVVESDHGMADSVLAELQAIMGEVPDWASGLPIDTEGFTARRYRK